MSDKRLGLLWFADCHLNKWSNQYREVVKHSMIIIIIIIINNITLWPLIPASLFSYKHTDDVWM